MLFFYFKKCITLRNQSIYVKSKISKCNCNVITKGTTWFNEDHVNLESVIGDQADVESTIKNHWI